MEQVQNNSKVMTAYPALPSYTYPQHQPGLFGDTIVTNYVHSLTSSPCYYFIPYSPHPRYAYSTNSCIRQSDNNNFIVRPTVVHETNSANDIVPYGYPRVIVPNQVVPHHNTASQEGVDCNPNGDKLEREDDDNKSIDPRIVNLLEPFRQIFSEHEGTLKTIFPGLYSKLSEFFKKVNSLIMENVQIEDVQIEGEKSTKRTLKRSLSLGDTSTCKNERFRIRPIDSEDSLMLSKR